MSTTTSNLGLFKYDTTNPTDLAAAFNINQALNNNWDIIDNAISNSGGARNIGEIVASTIPLTDTGLHLLDGALISGRGAYADFVNYIKNLYNDNPNANYFCKNTTIRSYNYESIGELSCTDGILNGFSSTTHYANAKVPTNPTTSMEFVTRIKQSPLAQGTIVYAYNNAGGFYLRSETGTMYCTLFGVTQWYDINLPLSADTWTYYKLTWDGTTYRWYSSINGTSWTEGTSITSSTPLDFKGYMHLGGCNWEAVPFETGSIDLNNSYLKCNGSYVWKGYTDTTYTSEQLWQKYVTDYGVCGKFVYDSTNNTVRLPKVTGFVEGASGATSLGDLTEAGLPNITGQFTVFLRSDATNGAFSSLNTAGSGHNASTQAFNNNGWVDFKASRSSSIYGNSSTVQPQSVKVLYYIVIATSTKTDIQVDIDEVVTDLNGKADTDLSNVPTSKGILTTSYKNGTSWYRVYSDGWCEQGGKSATTTTGWVSLPVSFLKTFIDTNYNIVMAYDMGNTSNQYTHCQIVGCTRDGVTLNYYAANTNGTTWWRAAGYIR